MKHGADILHLLVFTGILAGLCACSSATLSFKSEPAKADIFASALGGSQPKLIGQTPLTIKASDLLKQLGGVGPAVVEFRKDGRVPSKAIITDVAATDLTVSMDLSPSSGLEDQDKLNSVVDEVFEGQRLARVGRYDEAIKQLKVAEKDAPQLSATYELEGGIYYLQKKYKDALDAYGLAAVYDPKNGEAVRMRNLLEGRLGVTARANPDARAPASAAAPAKGGK